jgi:hypothetical protein
LNGFYGRCTGQERGVAAGAVVAELALGGVERRRDDLDRGDIDQVDDADDRADGEVVHALVAGLLQAR